jgi:hypothetical protein
MLSLYQQLELKLNTPRGFDMARAIQTTAPFKSSSKIGQRRSPAQDDRQYELDFEQKRLSGHRRVTQ